MTHTAEEIDNAVSVLVETVYDLPDKFFFFKEDDLSKGYGNRKKLSRNAFRLGNKLKLFLLAKDIDLSKLTNPKAGESDEVISELQKLLTVHNSDKDATEPKDETDNIVGELTAILTNQNTGG
jgi:hypothetical protein